MIVLKLLGVFWILKSSFYPAHFLFVNKHLKAYLTFVLCVCRLIFCLFLLIYFADSRTFQPYSCRILRLAEFPPEYVNEELNVQEHLCVGRHLYYIVTFICMELISKL